MTVLKRMDAAGVELAPDAAGVELARDAAGVGLARGAAGVRPGLCAGGVRSIRAGVCRTRQGGVVGDARAAICGRTDIRARMEGCGWGPHRRWSLAAAESGLVLAGAIHLVWAAGSPWPTASRDELADLVVGARPFPSGPMTLGVVGLIGVGAALVARESIRLSSAAVNGDTTGAERGAATSATDRALRLAALGVPAVLGLRGLGGLVVSGFGLGSATPQFRHWDLRLYSPLCLVLGALAFDAIRSDAFRREAHPPRPTGRQSSEGF